MTDNISSKLLFLNLQVYFFTSNGDAMHLLNITYKSWAVTKSFSFPKFLFRHSYFWKVNPCIWEAF